MGIVSKILAWAGFLTPGELFDAVRHGDEGRIKEILDQKPDFANAKNWEGWTPLCVAAAEGRVDIARLLVERGANVNFWNEKGNAPLYCAAVGDHVDVAELLLANGSEVNLEGEGAYTPLIWSVILGSAGVAQVLLAHGADVNHRVEEGATALSLAKVGCAIMADGGKPPAVVRRWAELEAILRKHGARE